MKMVVFRTKKKDEQRIVRLIGSGFERILFLVAVCIFIAIVFVQGAFLTPESRELLVGVGRPLAYEEYLYNEGQLAIALLESDGNANLKLLVNGDEVAAFDQNLVSLSVKNGDVIEIDASLTNSEAEIEIVSASENISGVEVGKKIKLNSSIEEITRIKLATDN